jgi:hypothetical protein
MKLSEHQSALLSECLIAYVAAFGLWGAYLGATGNIAGGVLCIIVLMWVHSAQEDVRLIGILRTMCENLLRLREEKK